MAGKKFTLSPKKRRKNSKQRKYKKSGQSLTPLVSQKTNKSDILELTPWDDTPHDDVQRYVSNLKLKNLE